ncbi:MAG: methionyl-tRNA formyltransferase [Clostridiales Family XIII bacterium]|jgi:methionyl-tRNA formyltransferase|nr:methionyl-tRNA formyltransferase [Clostridiales Family XIII bacterium]
MALVFMGTPDFAAVALRALASSGQTVTLAVTQPDRPRGRGHKLVPSPVKAAAESLGIEVAQPERIRGNGEFMRKLTELKPDLIVVAAYGQLLPKELIDVPRRGCVNIHASLLPRYRGAAPVHRAVEAGDEVTGVTLMRISEGLDEGDMLDSRAVRIGECTTGELTEKLAEAGAEMLLADMDALLAGELAGVPQDGARATYAPMVSKEEGRIDFAADPAAVLRKIRAMDPFPGAYTYLGGEKLKVSAAHIAGEITGMPPGTVAGADENGITVAAGSGAVVLDRVQLPGKKVMNAADFLRGHTVPKGAVLG